jgi:hypothetical protein
MATINTRYGYSTSVSDPNDDWITRKLIGELRSEQFDEPDDEHTQVSVGNEHWAVSAQVSGLITFDNFDLFEGEESDLSEPMHLRNILEEQLIRTWRQECTTRKSVATNECLAVIRFGLVSRRSISNGSS